jgi:hypothetical protein
VRWLSALALTIFVLFAIWLTGNVFFIHPADAVHHPETLADLQCTPEAMAGTLGLFGFLGTLLTLFLKSSFGSHSSEEGARHYFCGWHSSSYKEDYPLGYFILGLRPLPSRAFLLSKSIDIMEAET